MCNSLFSTKFKTLAILCSIFLISGCESADVETGTTTTNAGSSPSDDTTSEGTAKIVTTTGGTTTIDGETYTIITFHPASAVHTSSGNFTVLEISEPIVGYTYRWTLSDESLGRVSPESGRKTTYYTDTIPPTGEKVQTITVIGTKTDASIKYRGTFTVTHRAP